MGKYSFPKSDRLLKRKDFIKLSDIGKRQQNQGFIVLYELHDLKEGFLAANLCVRPIVRLGITVTKKVGCASARNRIKRQIREFFRKQKHRINKSCDINVIAKRDVIQLTNEQVSILLKDLFDRLIKGFGN